MKTAFLGLGVMGFPMALRINNAIASYVKYLAKTFWPTHLAIFYPHPDLRHSPRVRVFLDFLATEVGRQRRFIEGAGAGSILGGSAL